MDPISYSDCQIGPTVFYQMDWGGVHLRRMDGVGLRTRDFGVDMLTALVTCCAGMIGAIRQTGRQTDRQTDRGPTA
jgi:hypothetical protein